MYCNQKILAVIPARAGSKGLPRKNILDCAGKPLIAWTIEAAIQSKYIDTVIVTTDSEEIAKIASSYGAWTPFIRPSEIATDVSSIVEVINHVKKWIVDNTRLEFDFLIMLQPTSPLRDAYEIDKSIEYYCSNRKKKLETLISVCEVNPKYRWIISKDRNESMFCLGTDMNDLRRQNLMNLYMPNGAIYISPFLNFNGFYKKVFLTYLMNKNKSIDVDSRFDFEYANKVLSRK